MERRKWRGGDGGEEMEGGDGGEEMEGRRWRGGRKGRKEGEEKEGRRGRGRGGREGRKGGEGEGEGGEEGREGEGGEEGREGEGGEEGREGEGGEEVGRENSPLFFLTTMVVHSSPGSTSKHACTNCANFTRTATWSIPLQYKFLRRETHVESIILQRN